MHRDRPAKERVRVTRCVRQPQPSIRFSRRCMYLVKKCNFNSARAERGAMRAERRAGAGERERNLHTKSITSDDRFSHANLAKLTSP